MPKTSNDVHYDNDLLTLHVLSKPTKKTFKTFKIGSELKIEIESICLK